MKQVRGNEGWTTSGGCGLEGGILFEEYRILLQFARCLPRGYDIKELFHRNVPKSSL
jgi:hypothetical protein